MILEDLLVDPAWVQILDYISSGAFQPQFLFGSVIL